MAKAIITADERTALPEPLQKEYKEHKDGKFILSVEPVNGFDLQDIGGLTTALQTERSDKKKLNEQLAAFGGLDVEAAKAALEQVKNFDPENASAEAKAAHDAKISELVKAHELEKDGLTTKNTGLISIIQKEMIESRAAVLMARDEVRGNPTLLMPHILQEAKVVPDGDQFRVSVIDPATGQERIMATGDRIGQPMGLDGLLEDMRKRPDLSAGFKGPDASGSGSTTTTGTGGSSGDHTISQTDAQDIGKYKAAKAEAEKAGAELQISE